MALKLTNLKLKQNMLKESQYDFINYFQSAVLLLIMYCIS